jgi:hypothetical protein
VAWRAFFAVCAPLVFEPVRQYLDFVTNFSILNMGVSGIFSGISFDAGAARPFSSNDPTPR